MTDTLVIGSAHQPDPPGTVLVKCACRTTPMQREEETYQVRCRVCGVANKVPGTATRLLGRHVTTVNERIQERTY